MWKDKISYDIGPDKKVLRGDCYFSFSSDIIEYSIKNPNKLIELKQNLDEKSQDIANTIHNRLYYIYTHNIMERDQIISKKEMDKDIQVKKQLDQLKNQSTAILGELDETIFYYKHGLKYIPEHVISKIKDKDFIDGGAFIGDSAIMFRSEYHPRKIYSFEPEQNNFLKLEEMVKENNFKDIIPLDIGLASSNTTRTIFNAGSGSNITDNNGQEVKLTTIDDFVIENKLDVGLIKLDIEGYGFEAMKGAKNTIKKNQPILLISIYHSAEEFFEIKPFIESLNLDYKIIIRKLAPIKPFFDTTLIAWVN